MHMDANPKDGLGSGCSVNPYSLEVLPIFIYLW
jgi:hypothetical protein